MNIGFSKIRPTTFTALVILCAIMISAAAGNLTAQGSGFPTESINIPEFSFTPSSIDSTNGTQTVTVTIRVTDSERDIRFMTIVFRSPRRGHGYGLDAADRISGNARDGVYRKTFTFGQYAEAGIWVVDNIRVTDGTNEYFRWRELNTTYLSARGFPTQLHVINTNEADPPEISDFSFTPSIIGIPRNVTISLRAKDVASGVTSIAGSFSNPPNCYVYDEPCGTISFAFTDADRISGDRNDGVYRVAVDVSLEIPPGTYSATVWAVDGVRNQTMLRSYDLLARGFATQLQVSMAPFVAVSGRILTPNGNGLRNARVTLTDAQGSVRTATASSLGYYSFDSVSTGSMYTIAVSSKRFRFVSQNLQINSSLTNVDFEGIE